MLTANQPLTGSPPDSDTGGEEPGIILHAGWRNAAEAVMRGVHNRSLVLLIGPREVGKSALLHALHTDLQKSGVECARLSPGDRLPAKPATLLVDDADLLSDADFQAITRRTAATVLAGSPALAGRLAGWRRQAVVVDLAPLTANETAQFLGAWLERTQTPLRFSPAAIAVLARLTDGLPGGITALAKLATFLAGLEAAPMVQPSHVDEASGVDMRVDPDALDDEPLELTVADPDQADEPPVVAARRRQPGLVIICWLAAASIIAGAYLWRTSSGRPGEALWDSAVMSVSPPPVDQLADMPPPGALQLDVPLHVEIHVPANDPAAQANAATLATALRGRGYDVAEPAATRTRTPDLEVRYYFHQDNPAVTHLAQTLRAPANAVQFTAPPGGSLPPPGGVLVILPASGGAASAANQD